jgi:hypothetical protein
VARCSINDLAGHHAERDSRSTRILRDFARERNRSLSYPLPTQPCDFPEPLSGEDKKLDNRSIRIADFPRPIPHLEQFIVSQDAVARLLGGFLDANAR